MTLPSELRFESVISNLRNSPLVGRCTMNSDMNRNTDSMRSPSEKTMNDALFQSTELGPVQLPNRIMSSGHQTTLVRDHLPTDDFSAYHLARAKGGAGLVVLEAHAVHESGLLNDHTIDASTDAIVDAHKPFTEAMHNADTRVMVQLFHGGRERYAGEYAPPALSASDKPTDRLHVIPRPLETAEVYEMIDAFRRRCDSNGTGRS